MGIAYNPKIVTDGLTLCLDAGNSKSYPGSGTTWSDLSKSGVDCTLHQSPTFSTDHFIFNGTTQWASLDTLVYGGGNGTLSEMSVFAWVKTGFNSGTPGNWSNANWAILDYDRSEVFTFAMNGPGEIQMSGRSSNRGGIGSGSLYDIVGTTRFNDDEWHYIGYTFSVTDQEILMYGDGELDRTFTANGSMTALGSGSTRYGIIADGSESSSPNSGKNNVFYDGEIAAIHFYENKVLTPSEIKQNYNTLRGRFET